MILSATPKEEVPAARNGVDASRAIFGSIRQDIELLQSRFKAIEAAEVVFTPSGPCLLASAQNGF